MALEIIHCYQNELSKNKDYWEWIQRKFHLFDLGYNFIFVCGVGGEEVSLSFWWPQVPRYSTWYSLSKGSGRDDVLRPANNS